VSVPVSQQTAKEPAVAASPTPRSASSSNVAVPAKTASRSGWPAKTALLRWTLAAISTLASGPSNGSRKHEAARFNALVQRSTVALGHAWGRVGGSQAREAQVWWQKASSSHAQTAGQLSKDYQLSKNSAS